MSALAVQLVGGVQDPGLVRALVLGAGAAPRSVESFHAPGWHRVGLGRTVHAGELLGAVVEVASDPRVHFATPLWTMPDGRIVAPTAEILVRLKSPGLVGESALGRLAPDLRVVESNLGGVAGAFRARPDLVDGFAVIERVRGLRQSESILWAESDCLFEGSSAHAGATQGNGPVIAPSDPLFGLQWAHENDYPSSKGFDIDLDTQLAWALTKGSQAVPVMVIDVGVDLAHPDLTVTLGADFTGAGGGGGPVEPCDKHGTAVAGCIGAIHDNGLGVAGAAPDAALFSARCFVTLPDCTGAWTTQYSWTAAALAWGADNGARVSVNSNYYNQYSFAIANAYEQTRGQGMVHFASAGNSSGAITWPASLPEVHAITAMTDYGTLASFSCKGPQAGFCAPGQGIWTTDVSGDGGYVEGDVCQVSGTSYAAPLAASVAALVLAMDPTLEPDQVDQILRDTAGDLGAPGWDPSFGSGLPRAGDAVRHAVGLLRLLHSETEILTLVAGGVQELELAAGPLAGGLPYLVLGAASAAVQPNSGEGIGSLPLAIDAYTIASLQLTNQGPFVGTFGLLDGTGHGLAAIAVPAGSDPALSGLVLTHAYLVLEPALAGIDGAASEAVELCLVGSPAELPDPTTTFDAPQLHGTSVAGPPPSVHGPTHAELIAAATNP
ncbi:S8 family peptidase [Engelhardtia mirabilis]|uniref:S8 family peptidase n=1 Tax=Engelhardtia mirabilis TaxID=2528011 RepID=UPI003AF4027A